MKEIVMQLKAELKKFNAETEEEYVAKLSKMTQSDLQRHGHTFNIRTSYDRKRAMKTLVGMFRNIKLKLDRLLTSDVRPKQTKEQIEALELISARYR